MVARSAGSSYVIFGAATASFTTFDLASLPSTRGFQVNGAAVNDGSGFSVSGAVDVNGDNFDDFIIGAYAADPYGRGDAGSSYAIFGAATASLTTIDLA